MNRRGALRLAAVTVVALILTLFAAELFLRRATTYVVRRTIDESKGSVESDPEFLVMTTGAGRRLVPNARVVIRNHYLSKQDVPIDTNSLGLRGPELPPQRDPNETRIYVAGDSITLSDWLPLGQTYPALTEELLREESRQAVRVLNGGVNNTGTEEQVRQLEELVAAVDPNLIVLSWYLNDSRPPWGFSGEVGDRGWLRRHSLLFETIYTRFKQRRYIEEIGRPQFRWIEEYQRLDWKSDRGEFAKLVESAEFDWGAGWREDSLERLRAPLQRLAELARTRGVPVVAVMFPVMFQVEASFLDDRPQRLIEPLFKDLGFRTVDLLPVLRGHAGRDLFLDQCHLTEEGSLIVARELASALADVI